MQPLIFLLFIDRRHRAIDFLHLEPLLLWPLPLLRRHRVPRADGAVILTRVRREAVLVIQIRVCGHGALLLHAAHVRLPLRGHAGRGQHAIRRAEAGVLLCAALAFGDSGAAAPLAAAYDCDADCCDQDAESTDGDAYSGSKGHHGRVGRGFRVVIAGTVREGYVVWAKYGVVKRDGGAILESTACQDSREVYGVVSIVPWSSLTAVKLTV